jgi:hypothetical protein
VLDNDDGDAKCTINRCSRRHPMFRARPHRTTAMAHPTRALGRLTLCVLDNDEGALT